MKYILLPILFFIFSCNMKLKTSKSKHITEYREKGSWIQLFNGKDINDWTSKFAGEPLNVNYKNTFRVEDGILKVSYDEYDKFNNKFGHLFYKTKLSNYKLRVEYRFTGDQAKGGPDWAFRNNGLMLHCQSPESMELNQNFPVSIEAQLLGGNEKGERPTAGVCTPGTNIEIDGKLITRHCTSSSAKTYNGEQWVTVEIKVHSSKDITHFVEGKEVLSYDNPTIGGSSKPKDFPIAEGTPLGEGFIAIQAESHPTEFRKIELVELEVIEKNIKTP